MNDWRDAHFARIVEEQVIKKGRKALSWIGGAHTSRRVIFPDSLIHLLDRRFPDRTLVPRQEAFIPTAHGEAKLRRIRNVAQTRGGLRTGTNVSAEAPIKARAAHLGRTPRSSCRGKLA
jgi:hypothetical protein